jgi:peptidoglycan hydrolase CwlO-like protein
LKDFKKHAEEKLGPSCVSDNLDLCDDEKKEALVKALIEDLQLQIKTLTDEIDTLQSEIDELNLNMRRGVRTARRIT